MRSKARRGQGRAGAVRVLRRGGSGLPPLEGIRVLDLTRVLHPKSGRVKMFGVPIRLRETPGGVTVPPPLLGQHTDEILTRLAGLTRAEVARLRRQGIC